MCMGTVIMLSGPVGAGKTRVARELIALLPGPLSYIEGDTFWPFIAKAETRSAKEISPVLIREMK
jgi:adenylate kinase family enzyme